MTVALAVVGVLGLTGALETAACAEMGAPRRLVRSDDPPVEDAAEVFGPRPFETPQPARPRNPCDAERLRQLQQQVAGSHKGLFYNNDFSYLDDPCYDGWHLGDRLKRYRLGTWGMVDVGGEYRLRYHGERNIRGLGLTGLDDDFLLQRSRVYGNVELGERVRVYAEMIDAQSNFESLPPRATEENRYDLLNLFADFRLLEGSRGELWARVGRQELLYGAERLVSPLPRGNTRRNFEGYKMMWQGENWDIDAFWVRPVAVQPRRFDAPVPSREFMGLYATSKMWEDRTIDWYYLRFLDTDRGLAPPAAPLQFDTLGIRWDRQWGNWLAEAEAAIQWGAFGGAGHTAGMFTLGGGRRFPNARWKPVLWVYYDWASGDAVQGNGFHHLFPLGHRYLGWMDLFGRRNIQDINFRLTLQPHERVKLLLWHHVFFLQRADDVPYTVAMTPAVAAPGGSQHLGQELDLALEWTVTPRTHLLLGYSHFFAGDFYRTNPTAPFSGDADFFYTQYTVQF